MASLSTIMLAAIVWLLLEIHRKKQYLPASANDWVILEWHTLVHSNCGSQLVDREPLNLIFLPVLGWEIKQGSITPVTDQAHRIKERLEANPMDKETRYETKGYVVRGGVIFDLEGMGHSDLWERIYGYAFAGCEVKVENNAIPDCFSAKFAEITEIYRRIVVQSSQCSPPTA